MQQKFGLREFGRTVLTVTGIVLLIVFGARAASQASSLAAVGGKTQQYKTSLPSNMQWLMTLNTQNYAANTQVAFMSSSTGVNKPDSTSTQPEHGVAKLNEVARNLAAKAKRTADASLVPASDKYETTNQLSQIDTSSLTKYKHAQESVK